MSQDRLEQARQLMAGQHYVQARALLRTLGDDPAAQELLAQLDQVTADDTLHVSPRGAAARRTGPAPVPDTGDARIRELGTYEMQWDCKFCGTTKLLGKTHRFCPNCGAAQDPNTRYFPSDEEKVAVEDHVFVGVDVTCGSCGTLNSASAQFCMQCGAPLTDAARAQRLADQTHAAGEQFASSGSRDVVQEQFNAEMERVGVRPSAAAGGEMPAKQKAMIVVGVIAAVLICVALVFVFTRTREASVEVAGHSWERIIYVQEYGPTSESAWREQVPGDAYNMSCHEAVRSYRQVPDGEECTTRRVDNGDGTFSEREECRTRYRDEPVYDTRCTYTVDRWHASRQATASGSSLSDPPRWPDANIRTGSCRGCERESGREERYVVRLRESEGDATFECTFSTSSEWQAMAVGSRWTMDVGAVLGNANCDSLEPVG